MRRTVARLRRASATRVFFRRYRRGSDVPYFPWCRVNDLLFRLSTGLPTGQFPCRCNGAVSVTDSVTGTPRGIFSSGFSKIYPAVTVVRSASTNPAPYISPSMKLVFRAGSSDMPRSDSCQSREHSADGCPGGSVSTVSPSSVSVISRKGVLKDRCINSYYG